MCFTFLKYFKYFLQVFFNNNFITLDQQILLFWTMFLMCTYFLCHNFCQDWSLFLHHSRDELQAVSDTPNAVLHIGRCMRVKTQIFIWQQQSWTLCMRQQEVNLTTESQFDLILTFIGEVLDWGVGYLYHFF